MATCATNVLRRGNGKHEDETARCNGPDGGFRPAGHGHIGDLERRSRRARLGVAGVAHEIDDPNRRPIGGRARREREHGERQTRSTGQPIGRYAADMMATRTTSEALRADDNGRLLEQSMGLPDPRGRARDPAAGIRRAIVPSAIRLHRDDRLRQRRVGRAARAPGDPALSPSAVGQLRRPVLRAARARAAAPRSGDRPRARSAAISRAAHPFQLDRVGARSRPRAMDPAGLRAAERARLAAPGGAHDALGAARHASWAGALDGVPVLSRLAAFGPLGAARWPEHAAHRGRDRAVRARAPLHLGRDHRRRRARTRDQPARRSRPAPARRALAVAEGRRGAGPCRAAVLPVAGLLALDLSLDERSRTGRARPSDRRLSCTSSSRRSASSLATMAASSPP